MRMYIVKYCREQKRRQVKEARAIAMLDARGNVEIWYISHLCSSREIVENGNMKENEKKNRQFSDKRLNII